MHTGGRQYVPGRHLTDVFIADKSFHSCAIGRVADITCMFLCEPGCAKAVVKIRHEVYRLIGMVVVRIPFHVGRSSGKQCVEIGYGGLSSTYQRCQTVGIVRYKPSLLVGIRFHAAESLACTRRRCLIPFRPCAVGHARAEPSDCRVKHIAVGHGSVAEHGCQRIVATHLRKLRHTPVGISIFQCARYAHRLGGISQTSCAEFFRSVYGILQCFPYIECTYPFGICVGYHRDGRVADHASRIGVEQLPPWIILTAAFFGYGDQ